MRAAVHEIRNHLAVAIAGIEAILDRKLEATDARFVGILHALREVNSLIGDLPRDRTIEFETRAEPIDICELIGIEAGAMEGYAIERGVSLSVSRCACVNASCARYFGDPVRIGEIVTNVLTNAINYTPSGGNVDVDCRPDGPNLRFSVSDEGPGVDIAERGKIFESGYRGANASTIPGSGVGLALVKQFVEGHGGTVDVANRNRGGATFTVKLPAFREA